MALPNGEYNSVKSSRTNIHYFKRSINAGINMTSMYDPDYIPPEGWQQEAACRGYDPNQFIPETDPTTGLATSPEELELQILLARTVCKLCPVKQDCFNVAVRNNEKSGLWGRIIFNSNTVRNLKASERRIRKIKRYKRSNRISA